MARRSRAVRALQAVDTVLGGVGGSTPPRCPEMSAKLTVTGWMDYDERERKVADIAQQLHGAPEGSRFRYRGIIVRKSSSQSRGDVEGDVVGPDGVQYDELDFRGLRTSELVDRLDAARREAL